MHKNIDTDIKIKSQLTWLDAVRYQKRVLFENRPALYFCNYKENKKNWYTYVRYRKLMIAYTLWSNIIIIRIIIIIVNKNI